MAVTAADHALATLLWSESPEGADDIDDTQATGELIERVKKDWESFREQAEAMGFDAVEHRAMMINREHGDEWDHAAHDFILTRNGHGAGFWDGDWHEPWGERLTELCKVFGPLEVSAVVVLDLC